MNITIPKEFIGAHGLVIKSDGSILLLLRSKDDENEPLSWDLPGGGLDRPETIENGFQREVEEETGLHVTGIEILGAYETEDNSLQLITKCTTTDTDVKISSEHEGYKWVSLEEMMSVQPVSLHLRAVKELLLNKARVVTYEKLMPVN